MHVHTEHIEATLPTAHAITSAFQASDIGIAVYDRDLRILSSNPAFGRLRGLPPGCLQPGTTLQEVISGSLSQRPLSEDQIETMALGAIERLLREGADHINYEDAAGASVRISRHRRPSGLVVETVHPMQGDDGNAVDGHAAGGRVQAVGRRRLTQALESMADGFALFSSDGVLVAVNERYRELSPYLGDALRVGTTHADIIRAVYRSGEVEIEGYTEEEFVAFADRERLSPGEPTFHRTKDGRWMRYAPRRLEDGSTLFLQSDVSELKAHEERANANDRKLARRTSEFETAMSAMLDGFIMFDADNRMIACNDRYREMLGFPDTLLKPGVSRDVLVRAAEDLNLFASESIEDAAAAYRASLGRSDHHSFHYAMADGRTLQMRYTPLAGGGAVLIVLDRTAELRAAEKLKRYSRQLERSNAELQNFAYVASHDLQEPLRKIEAFGDRLSKKHGEALPENGRHYLERILDASTRMRQLINDLLSFSRVSSKAHTPGRTDLSDIVREVAGDMQVRLEETGATLDVGELPTLEADPTLMRQLFQNLVANAIKFSREGVAPVVRISAEHKVVQDEGALPRESVVLSVRDNGIGFENRFKEQIFTIFQRLHGRSEYEGTGIGLATCRRIVERHNGTIDAHGVPGEGATFVVELPTKQPSQDAA